MVRPVRRGGLRHQEVTPRPEPIVADPPVPVHHAHGSRVAKAEVTTAMGFVRGARTSSVADRREDPKHHQGQGGVH